MNIQRILNFTASSALAVSAVTLMGYAGSSNELSNSPVLGSASPATSQAFGDFHDNASDAPQIPFNDTNYISVSNQELRALAEVPRTETASIQVFDDFAFETARRTMVNLHLPNATDLQAEATFCTDYRMKPTGNYEVNYNSCVLSAPIFGGAINEELNLPNQYASVIGVVPFQDENIQPMYQEFHFD